VQNRMVAAAFVLSVAAAGVAGCAQAQTTPLKPVRLTLDGATHTMSPPACSQLQSYRTVDITDHGGQVEAVMLISGYRAIPQWVKIRNIDGFTGSFWEGGVGSARVDATHSSYTITGSAYGINNRNPNKAITTDFKIIAEC
jgi:Mycobacterium 19 kDa lipoprotein antigen